MKYHSHVYRQLARDASHLGGVPLWLAFRCLPSLLLGALFLLLLSIAPARAMLEEGSGEPDINGVESGQLLLLDQADGSYTPALIHSSKVHFDISGMIATVSVQQSFRNDTDRWLEGVYAFPLPDTAAVRYLEMVIGERRIVGKIREKGGRQTTLPGRKKGG